MNQPTAPCSPPSTNSATSRQVKPFGIARGAGHSERAEFALAHQRRQRRDGADVHLHPAAQHIGDRLGTALVGNVGDLGVGCELEHLADELRQGALAEAKVELARIGFRVGNELLQSFGRHVGCDH